MRRLDSKWLTLRASLRDILIEEHYQAYTALNFSSMDEQSPQLITLLGQQVKTMVIKKLRFGPRTQEASPGEVHLRSDTNSKSHEHPRIFADCKLHNSSSIPQEVSDQVPSNIINRPLTWHQSGSQTVNPPVLAHMLYAKLIAPFSTVICFFSEDFGGLTAVAKVLALWLLSFSNRPSNLPAITHPRVLILTRNKGKSGFDEQSATKRFMLHIRKESEKQMGMLTGKAKLRKAKLNQLLSTQFGARHFKALFHMACNHFCSKIVSPFSFIRASQIPSPIPLELPFHLMAFMKQIDRAQIMNFAVPVITSALMFKSYPQGMHPFHPSLVFQQFYYQVYIGLDPFRRNLDGSAASSPPQLANAIEAAFCQYTFQAINGRRDAVSIHKEVLAKFKPLWKPFYSNTTCLVCLARRPEHALTCHHSLCSPCMIDFGQSPDSEPWNYWIEQCPLCEEGNQTSFQHKPNTAGVRAIIAEGGGVRGIVPLTFLKELQRVIGLPMSIQEHFDVAFGSSSGALSVLGLFINRWSVDECIARFKELSSLAFRKKKFFDLPLIPSNAIRGFLETILAIATDSKYSSTGINTALQAAFGEAGPFFGSSSGGTKVAIVATTTDDSTTCVFANYNGPENRSKDCGYKLIRPNNIDKELLVWQAARASTAAPGYFKSFQGYQDGGLGGHNNPINLALWEQDAIWDRQQKQPDIVLSLGTGFRRVPDAENEKENNLTFVQALCGPRLFRSFLNMFVGEKRWQELQNTLLPHTKERYHRMNIEFFGDEPSLDDIPVMPSLEQQTNSQARSSDHIQKCADNLLASLFYIELNGVPMFDGISFVCNGKIFCRIGSSHQALRVLVGRLREYQARFYLGFNQSILCVDEGLYEGIGRGAPFCRSVVFKVLSLQDAVDIKIDGITKRARSISNCPYRAETLVKDQGLDCVFGRRASRKRKPADIDHTIKRVKFG
ncbi:Calcium-independent phospholipase A2-gamma [Lachnellula willkommii]|uniref:Calcium-independent phospholipase A2-gamma n=1 Tax=Lachnellula willkommii TaxID=215461 RepID=A0A559MHD2_9HELO|nr:Calcium-independent phospholipase A2-gamma [Lachnellula willkommii]